MRRLLIRPGGIGDVIVSLPALEHLAREASFTEVWTTTATVPLIGFADRVRAIADTGLDTLEIRPSARLREILAGFDEIHTWYGSGREQFRDAMQGLPVRFHAALPASPAVHATDFYLAQVGAAGGAVPRIAVPGIPLPRDDRGFAAIHPFSGSLRKNWPRERFAEVAAQLALPVEWIAGPEEELPGARRFDDLSALARWLAGASVYLGNDSGITHLAAACGVPVVAVFGPTDPAVWAPRGRVAVVRQPSLDAVTVASVRSAAARVRDPSTRPPTPGTAA